MGIFTKLYTTLYSQMVEYSCGVSKKQIRVTSGNFVCGFVRRRTTKDSDGSSVLVGALLNIELVSKQ